MKNVQFIETEIDFSTPSGAYNLGEVLAIGANILYVFLQVKSVFDGLPSVTIGDTTNSTKYMDENSSDLFEEGNYIGLVLDKFQLISQCRIYWNPGDSTKGNLRVCALITEP
ncbi:hypothetical protein LEP1GSC178_0095 [Leptospira licerasiae str. MMD4847]|uniref:Uncharacterized protein n=1 Tax=Leptospira licerasiae str. MMD4847 TaxID=1049971 RepID=A0ABN0H9R9_9LEPT|nr:hypothetical protein LEP1GSC178_0095 [Leptospira licerasiae str. MMD4847]